MRLTVVQRPPQYDIRDGRFDASVHCRAPLSCSTPRQDLDYRRGSAAATPVARKLDRAFASRDCTLEHEACIDEEAARELRSFIGRENRNFGRPAYELRHTANRFPWTFDLKTIILYAKIIICNANFIMFMTHR